ncbi:hypothetical protein [Microbispora sp. ATCC PTA-5024]|uniref:hypothetical protein n=1 Tax=Microbispora sp. ATCC PTA-5024 TaxID=316330 RepID=UPI0003DD71A3|nr:hypothetical protein [Microbispora sp. ATCC PTA-5024]ETK34650.1 hypothetical protein MPTA5024_17945 [Microbispora sp. ATCC PTA-5024]
MTTARVLAGIAVAAALVTIAPAAAQASAGSPAAASAAPKSWGPAYAPGKAAKASGTIAVTGLSGTIPAVGTAHVTGKVYDRTKGSSCGWAVFRVTYRKADGNLPFIHKAYRTCNATKPKSFSFTYPNTYEVELKVCSEATSKPSLNCLYAGTWKVLYVSH